MTATSGASETAARNAAPRIPLFKKNQLTVYGGCFLDSGEPRLYAEAYVATTVAGAIFDGDQGGREGGPTAADFLNPKAPEVDRVFDQEDTTSTDFDPHSDSDFHAMAPNGTRIDGTMAMAIQRGSLAGGTGLYGAGNVCPM